MYEEDLGGTLLVYTQARFKRESSMQSFVHLPVSKQCGLACNLTEQQGREVDSETNSGDNSVCLVSTQCKTVMSLQD